MTKEITLNQGRLKITFISETNKTNDIPLKHASVELRNDKEVVLVAIGENGYALKYASKELQNNKEVVIEAVRENYLAFQFASEELQKDEDVIFEEDKSHFWKY
jgi:hypothetical protein